MIPEAGKTYRYTKQPLSPPYYIVEVNYGKAYGYPVGDPNWAKEIQICLFKHMWDDLVEVNDDQPLA